MLDIHKILIMKYGPEEVEYYFTLYGRYFGPYQFATIAILHKLREEGRCFNALPRN